jgi:hypothetical protein
MGIPLNADLRQINDVYFSTSRTHRIGIVKADLAHFRPAAVERDVVAVNHQRRYIFQGAGFGLIAGHRRFNCDDRLDLVGARLRYREAEAASLAVEQQNARADFVDQSCIGGDDR